TLTELTANIARIGSEFNGSSTAYYLVLEGHNDLLFSVQGSISDELAVTREGDSVKVTYYERKEGTQELSSFDNLKFS
ncbi:MAG: cell shape-determining protein, partial [Ruthenibacterium sp.]